MNVTTMPRSAAHLPSVAQTTATVGAPVYRGPGTKALEDHAKPRVTAPTDTIRQSHEDTTCGTDLHILKEDVSTCEPVSSR